MDCLVAQIIRSGLLDVQNWVLCFVADGAVKKLPCPGRAAEWDPGRVQLFVCGPE